MSQILSRINFPSTRTGYFLPLLVFLFLIASSGKLAWAEKNNKSSNFSTFVNVKNHGATGLGRKDEIPSIKAALRSLSSSGGTLFFPAGSYFLNSQLTIPKNVSLTGEGPGQSIISCDGASGQFPKHACIYSSGEPLAALPPLSKNIDALARTLSFTSPPKVNRDDLIIIYDHKDSSYSEFRSYYHAGEFALVESVSESNINLSAPIFGASGYESDKTISVYRMSNPTQTQVRDLQIIGHGAGTAVDTLLIENGRNVHLENLILSNSSDSTLTLRRNFNSTVSKVYANKFLPDVFGTSYGLNIANSQNIRVINSDFLGRLHGITIAGGDSIGDIVNRNILISNTYMRTLATGGSTTAFGGHGNQEYVSISNSILDGGATLAGNHNSIKDTLIFGTSGEGIHFYELSGMDHTIADNEYFARVPPPTGRGSFIDMGGNSNTVLNSKTKSGGVLLVHGNKVHYPFFDDPINAVRIVNRGAVDSDLRVIFSDNVLLGSSKIRGNDFGILVQVTSGDRFEFMEISGNHFEAFGIQINGAENAIVKGNTVRNSGLQGISLYITNGETGPVYYEVSGNLVSGSQLTGVQVSTGANVQKIGLVKISSNSVIENNILPTGTLSLDSPLFLKGILKAVVQNNIFGGNQPHQENRAALYNIIELLETGNHYFGKGDIVRVK